MAAASCSRAAIWRTPPRPRCGDVRGAGIAMIFQEPMTALNPLSTIGDQIGEMFSIHTELSAAAIRAKVLALLDRRAHPRSEGRRARLSARIVGRPAPARHDRDGAGARPEGADRGRTDHRARRHHAGADSGVDPDLQERKKTAVLFITHDFGVVAEIADRVAVMQQGSIVEQGAAAAVLNHPQHPYTQKLIAAVPPLDRAATAPAVRRHRS